jgi:hypothetical protein
MLVWLPEVVSQRTRSPSEEKEGHLLQHLGERPPAPAPDNTVAEGDLMRFRDKSMGKGTGGARLG